MESQFDKMTSSQVALLNRSPGEGVVKATLLCYNANTKKERLEFYGNFYLHSGVYGLSQSYANLLIKITGELSYYRQFCLLSLFARKINLI